MEKLLEYQKLDSEIFKLEREINKNDSKKEAQSMVAVIKDAQNHIIDLDKAAKNLYEDIEKLKEVQNKGISLVEKYSKQTSSELNEKELVDLKTKIKQTARQLSELENRLLSNEQKSKRILQDFDANKKKLNVARFRHQEAKEKFESYYNSQTPALNQIKQKMQQLEKNIDGNMIAKYKSMKQDGVFPVIVPLVDNRCGGCRMELASGDIVKIKSNGKIECPSCHRIIYLK